MCQELRELVMDVIGERRFAAGVEEDDREAVQEMCDKVMEWEEIARKEGLLALEEAVSGFIEKRTGLGDAVGDEYAYRKLSGVERLLAVLAKLAVGGYDPEYVERMAVLRYYAGGFEGTAALSACMLIVGMLSIRRGDSPAVLRDQLLVFLPEELENRVLEKEAAKEELEKARTAKIPDRFFEDPEDGSAVRSPVADSINAVVLSMEDRDIQRMLREVENSALCLCLKVMSGKARKRIFENLSERLRGMFYEDMEAMGPVRLRDAQEAAVIVLKVIEKLSLAGEISLREDGFAGKSVEEIIAMQEHRILSNNRRIEDRIKALQAEAEELKRNIIKL